MDLLILGVAVALGLYAKWRQSLKQQAREADRLEMRQRLNSGVYDMWGEIDE